MTAPASATTSPDAVFLDRDGVVTVEGGGYVTTPDALTLLPGAAEAIARLNRCGLRVFLFTNQGGVGKGLLTSETLDVIHVRLRELLRAEGGELTAVYACPHVDADDCDCRKPRPGMLRRAAMEYGLDLKACYVVGDSPRDLASGVAAGCHPLLVLTGHTSHYDPAEFPAPQPERVFPDLPAAADWLCSLVRPG